MKSTATTPDQYLAQLDADQRETVAAIRAVILENLDEDYQEGMQYGMIGYSVPHSVYPAGYHCDPRQPLPFAALGSQKNHVSLYLMSIYCGSAGGEPGRHASWFREAWERTGKKLDMGKACIRFKRLEDVALEVIGEAVRRVPAKLYLDWTGKALAGVERARLARSTGRKKGGAKKATRTPAKKAAKRTAKK